MYKVGDRVQLCQLILLNGTSEKRWVIIKKILPPVFINGLSRRIEIVNQYLSHDNERFSEDRIINLDKRCDKIYLQLAN